MVVVNWIKDTFGAGSKLLLNSLNQIQSGAAAKIKRHLISDQRALAEHFESCSQNFINKLEQITEKIKDPSAINSANSAYIEKKQQDLFFACLRLDMALKSTAELKRERKEWERRGSDNVPFSTIHPLARIELIDSELRLREQAFDFPQVLESEHPASGKHAKITIITDQPAAISEDNMATVSLAEGMVQAPELDDLPEEYLVKQAENVLHELSSHQSSPMDLQEYSQKTAELRQLHASLKRLQRKNNRQKYRYMLRERMNQFFSQY